MQCGEHANRKIVPAEFGKIRTNRQTVRKNKAYNQEHGHAGNQRCTQTIVFFFVGKDKVNYSEGNERKPKKVRENKPFTERDFAVGRALDNGNVVRVLMLDQKKENQVNRHIADHKECVTIA